MSRVAQITKRADFLKAARAKSSGTPGFHLQARKRAAAEGDAELVRVGFTCSKKVGNAVARNRAKRRLREVARLTLPTYGAPGWDYVLIGRREVTAERPWPELLQDLETALAALHQTDPRGQGF
ncbi:MAG: ribonuclease P protein component [Pseudomonadota bacterium]